MNAKGFVSDFQIVGSRIVDLSIKNDFILMGRTAGQKKSLDVSHEIIEVEHAQNEDSLRGVLRLTVAVVVSEGKEKFRLKMTIEGCFLSNAETDEEHFRKMLVLNGITALYGIARAQIVAISSQAFVDGSVMLPMVNVAKYSRAVTQAENKKE